LELLSFSPPQNSHFDIISSARKSQAHAFDTVKRVCYYKTMKTGCLLGVALPQVLRFIFKTVEALLTLIAKLIVCFGLYIPLAYLAYGGFLWFAFDVSLFDFSVNSSLYLVGFGLSIIAAAIMTVRSGIGRFMEYKESKTIIQYKGNRRRSSAPEAPTIYKSRVNRGIIVYEYENRFDLYENDGDRLVFAGTEYKKKRGKRC